MTSTPTNRDPSPSEILERCAEIRKGWSADEHFRRMRADLRPSFIRADGIREDMDACDYDRHHSGRESLQGTPPESGPFQPGQKPPKLGPLRIVDTVSKQTES